MRGRSGSVQFPAGINLKSLDYKDGWIGKTVTEISANSGCLPLNPEPSLTVANNLAFL